MSPDEQAVPPAAPARVTVDPRSPWAARALVVCGVALLVTSCALPWRHTTPGCECTAITPLGAGGIGWLAGEFLAYAVLAVSLLVYETVRLQPSERVVEVGFAGGFVTCAFAIGTWFLVVANLLGDSGPGPGVGTGAVVGVVGSLTCCGGFGWVTRQVRMRSRRDRPHERRPPTSIYR